MKRVFAARNPIKQYKNIRFSGWTKGLSDILEQADLCKVNSDEQAMAELKRYVRYAISEAEDAAAKLNEYKSILESFNSSNASPSDLDTLINALSDFRFKQH